MNKIHCIHCNHINDANEMICTNCHKTLYEIDKYYTDMLKDHLNGRIKDSIMAFLLQLIKENIYGIILTITVISTVVMNVAIRSDNPKVVKESPIIVNEKSDGIKSNTVRDALKILGEAVYTNNFDLLSKSSYLYNFNNLNTTDINNLVNGGISLENARNNYLNEYMYIQITDYNQERYGLIDKYNSINNNALNILNNDGGYSNKKVVIPNLEEITSYELEVFIYKQEPYVYSNLDVSYHMTVFYVKVNGNWYYLYSSSADIRVIGTKSDGITYRDGDFVQLLS